MEQEVKNIVVGIDPGEKGGLAVLRGAQLLTYKMPTTYPDIFSLLSGIKAAYSPANITCVMERVGTGIPGQSSKATATFARHCGHLEMALYALGIPTEEVTPQKWQKAYSNSIGTAKGLTKTEWKNKLKGLAQRPYPTERVTLNTADAILLAHYGKMNNL